MLYSTFKDANEINKRNVQKWHITPQCKNAFCISETTNVVFSVNSSQNKKSTIRVLAAEDEGYFPFLLLLFLLLLLLVALPSPLPAYLPDPSPAHAESQ